MIELHADWDGAPDSGERTLVLLHGFTGDTTTWSPVRESLRKHGKTIALDLVGHGKSPKPEDVDEYKMAACVEQVVAALDKRGLRACWFVGYSMGGRVAVTLAAHHPERVAGLILESTSPGIEDATIRAARIKEDADLAEGITAWGVSAFVEQWLEKPMFAGLKKLSSAEQATQRTQRLRNSPVGLANSLRGMGSGSMDPVWDRIQTLRMPVLILAGQQDAKFVETAKRMHALLPHAQLHLFSGAGHTPHVTDPAAWSKQVDAFFETL
jgi:2-succinyl-6-hydroxy-2,4-cyclohexadiene-1-carboxylate synthase